MFREHPNATLVRLPDASPSAMGQRKQRIRRVRRHAVSVKLDTVHNTEAIIWLQVR